MPSPIPLPHASAESEKAVKLPAPPSQPPTAKDIRNSVHYSQDILTANARKKATNEDVVEAELYKRKLLSTREDGEPVWFAEAVNRALAPLAADIRTLKDDVRDLKGELVDVRRIAMRTSDISAGTGESG